MILRSAVVFIIGICCSAMLFTSFTKHLFQKLKWEVNLSYYRAAVLEAVPFMDLSMSVLDVVKKNLETYQLAANLAGMNDVDIIVFPEYALFSDGGYYTENRSVLIGSIASDIPDPTDNDYNPCDQKDTFKNHYLLRNLSCMAKSNNLYIVANVFDYKNCSNAGETTDKNATLNCSHKSACPSDGMYLYNTNVVFNKVGKLISRYYKKHTYDEPSINPSKCPYNGFFNTEFGNFTSIICFDVIFNESVETIKQLNVVNLLFPTFWYDFVPAYFATAFHQSYAFSNCVNMLVANAHVPGTGTLGSGIYSAQNGALISTHQPDGHTRLLITNVPSDPKNIVSLHLAQKRFKMVNGTFIDDKIVDDVILEDECEVKVVGPAKDMSTDYRCQSFNLTDYKFKRLIKSEDKIDLCVNMFCCRLSYKARSMNESYFLGVQASYFDFFNFVHYSQQVCFLAHCKSENGEDCTSFFMKPNTVFEKVEISGTLFNEQVFPFSIDSNIRLTSKDKWTYRGNFQMNYDNKKDDSSLLFLGVYGQNYSKV